MSALPSDQGPAVGPCKIGLRTCGDFRPRSLIKDTVLKTSLAKFCSSAKALRAAGVPESVIIAAGGWKTPAMFRRYAIVSSADQRAPMELLERARAANSPKTGIFGCTGLAHEGPVDGWNG